MGLALASSNSGEIWDLQIGTFFGSKFWTLTITLSNFHYFCKTTESKVSMLDNIVEKQALGKSIQIWKFLLGKGTDNGKHNWIKDYV